MSAESIPFQIGEEVEVKTSNLENGYTDSIIADMYYNEKATSHKVLIGWMFLIRYVSPRGGVKYCEKHESEIKRLCNRVI